MGRRPGGGQRPRGTAVAARPGVDQAEVVDVDVALDPRRVGVGEPQGVQAEAGERDRGRRRLVRINAAGRRQRQRAHRGDRGRPGRRVGVGGADRELGGLVARVGIADQHLILRGRADRLVGRLGRGRIGRGGLGGRQHAVLQPVAAPPVGRRQPGPAVGQVDGLARPERDGRVGVGARILVGVQPVVAGGLDPTGAARLPAQVVILRLYLGGLEGRKHRRRAPQRRPRGGPGGGVWLLAPARVCLRGELDGIQVVPAGDVPDGHDLAAGGKVDGRGEVRVVDPRAGAGQGQVARRGGGGERAGATGTEGHQGGRSLRRGGGPQVHHVGARLGDVDGVVQPVAAIEVADVVGPAVVGGRPLDANSLVGAVGTAGVARVGTMVGNALAAVVVVLRLDHRRAVRRDGPGLAVDRERRVGREHQAVFQRLDRPPLPDRATPGSGPAAPAGRGDVQVLQPTHGCGSVSVRV